MKMLNWWLNAPEKVPSWLWGILIPWILMGLLIAAVPELQQMPPPVRFVLGAPAALAIIWIIIGLICSVCDRLGMIGSRLRSLSKKAR